MAKFRNSVGQGCPNHKEDVLMVVGKFKEIDAGNGGFKGLPAQPALAPAEGGTCDDFLVGVIARFQADNGLRFEYNHQRGRIAVDKGMGGSTWQKMVALAGKPAAPKMAAPALDKLSALAGEQGAKQAITTIKTDTGGDLNWLVERLSKGVRTQWTLGGTGGLGAGFGAASVQAGSVTLVRPDHTELTYGLAGAGIGVSLAPGSVTYSGGDMPSGSGAIYRGKLSAAGELTDKTFAGKMLMYSAGFAVGLVNTDGAGGGTVSLCFFGLKETFWATAQDVLKNASVVTSLATGTASIEAVHKLIASSFDNATAVAAIWGTQAGTPDLGVSVSLCAAIPKERQHWFGLRSMLFGFGGAILTESGGE